MSEAERLGRSRAGPRTGRRIAFVVAALLVAFAALAVWCAFRARLYPVADLARSAPRRTALMNQRVAEAERSGHRFEIDQRWVPYERISPLLRRAVLVAEDDAFFEHGGLDWNEINASMRRNLERRRVVRGGSTITQQLARNVYLGDHRTITRKLTEAFLAIRLEQTLGKRRIFELYLNLIEWGDGVYGAEAAARHYFGVPAAALDARQSVLLAAVIINPRRFSVLAPSRRIERRVLMIAGRLHRRGALDDIQYVQAIGTPVVSDIAPQAPAESLEVPPVTDSVVAAPAADSDTVAVPIP